MSPRLIERAPDVPTQMPDRVEARGFSIIVPAYNEAAVIEDTLRALVIECSKLGRPFEIVVADDCSSDDTVSVVHSFSKRDDRVKVVTHVPNRGKGAAVRTGFAATRSPIVAYVDADIRPSAETLARYLSEIDGGQDIALANKWDKASHIEYSFARKFASYAYAVFAKALFWIPIVDTQCGFKFFDRRLLERAVPHVRVDRFGFDVELMAWCVHYGARITALPIEIEEIRESRVNSVEVLKMFKDLLIARIRMWQQRRMDRPAVGPAALDPELHIK